MTPKFDESFTPASDAVLLCPSCGGNYLHHESVEVFERYEDAKTGVHVAIANSLVAIDTNLTGNPSYRRDGLKVLFWCEHCGNHPVLSISQHKGSTLVDFRQPPETNQ